MKDLRQKVADLSGKQRLVLSRWLLQISKEESQHATSRKRLCAYVTTNSQNADLDSATLRSYLQEKLPDFMVPEYVSVLESLPLLPNGKINVAALSEASKTTDDKSDFMVEPRDENERVLANIWSELLNLDVLSVHDNFFEIGGDSIVSIQFISRAREAGLNIDPQHIVDYPTVAGLASVALKPVARHTKLRRSTGKTALTPIQQWLMSRCLKAAEHWNQAQLLEVDPSVNSKVLRKSVDYCVDHHDALRARFQETNGNWSQTIPGEETKSLLETISLPAHQVDELDQHIANQQAQFNLQIGPLVRFVLYQFGNGIPDRLLVVGHHLIIDAISWSILLEDLECVCQQLLQQKEPSLPAKTTSLVEWTQQLIDYSASDICTGSFDYWNAAPPVPINQLPTDYAPEYDPDEATADTVTHYLDEDSTQALLTEINHAYHTRAYDILLAALVQTLTAWTGQRAIRIDLEGHGREALVEGVDLSRTVGWFTSFFPVTFDLVKANDLASAIETVKEQWRSVPHQGLDYGVLRYISRDASLAKSLATLSPAQVLFNYLGTDSGRNTASIFKSLAGANDSSRHPLNQRSHLLEINAVVSDHRLALSWTYSRLVYKSSTITRQSLAMIDSLKSLIEHCQSRDSTRFTPSDFPEAEFSQDDLDAFLRELE